MKPSSFSTLSVLCKEEESHRYQTITYKENTTSISTKMPPSLHTLPVELVYRILDNLDDITIVLSCRNVCVRLNAITDAYHRYQVLFHFIIIRGDLGRAFICLWKWINTSTNIEKTPHIYMITISRVEKKA